MAETWLLYALLSMLFAGLTAVLAKFGLQQINADLGLAVRTAVIFGFVGINTLLGKSWRDWPALTPKQLLFLVLSGLATTLSWVCYYRAMKAGPVSYVAAIDKGSIVVTLLLSAWWLGEPLTPKLLLGGGLIVTGLLVLLG